MPTLEITIFTAPAVLKKYVRGRYICVLRSPSGSGRLERWFAEDSIVEISRKLATGLEINWSGIEESLLDQGVGHDEVSVSDPVALDLLFKTGQ